MAKMQQIKNSCEISTRGTFGDYKVDKIIIAGNVPFRTKTEEFILGHTSKRTLYRDKKPSTSKSNFDCKDLC